MAQWKAVILSCQLQKASGSVKCSVVFYSAVMHALDLCFMDPILGCDIHLTTGGRCCQIKEDHHVPYYESHSKMVLCTTHIRRAQAAHLLQSNRSLELRIGPQQGTMLLIGQLSSLKLVDLLLTIWKCHPIRTITTLYSVLVCWEITPSLMEHLYVMKQIHPQKCPIWREERSGGPLVSTVAS